VDKGLDFYVSEIDTKYVAPSGLLRLDLDDKRTDPSGLEDVQNDNGTLVLAYYDLLLGLVGLGIGGDRARKAIELLRVKGWPGLFHRHGGTADKMREAQDNYVAICYFSVRYKLPYAREIVDHGEKTGWNYNNLNPSQLLVQTQRQPGETAFYKLCAEETPAPLDYLHLCIGVCINAAFAKRNDNPPSVTLLAWLRLNTLTLIKKRPYLVGVVAGVWYIAQRIRFTKINNVISLFFKDPAHPIHDLSDYSADTQFKGFFTED
jgi:hypothetical protein